MTNHENITPSTHDLHGGLSSRLGDGSEVVHKLVFEDANARILDGECGIGLVGNNLASPVMK